MGEHITSWTGIAERDRLYREQMVRASEIFLIALHREAAGLARDVAIG
jgi:hypothetical protein